jgi:hypothetical protein
MSALEYLIWFVAMAIVTPVILTVGTLAAAGLLTRDRHHGEPPDRASATPEEDSTPAQGSRP